MAELCLFYERKIRGLPAKLKLILATNRHSSKPLEIDRYLFLGVKYLAFGEHGVDGAFWFEVHHLD